MKEIVTVRTEIGDKEVIIDGYVHYHVEAKYGADADGNRGEKRTIIDEVTDIQAVDLDAQDFKLTEQQEQRASDALVRKFLEG